MGLRQKILIIDDSWEFREALRIRLMNEGFDVCAVGAGQDGLDAIAREPFELVLLDMVMPEKDGIATYQELRANPQTRALPIILLTGLAVESHWEPLAYNTDGPAFVMGKPYDHTVLVKRIAEVLTHTRGETT